MGRKKQEKAKPWGETQAGKPVRTRQSDAFNPREGGRLAGDDLTAEDLDNLWTMFGGDETQREAAKDSMAVLWYEDKKHQIVYRLILRLTRAEKLLAGLGQLPEPTVGDPASPPGTADLKRAWAAVAGQEWNSSSTQETQPEAELAMFDPATLTES